MRPRGSLGQRIALLAAAAALLTAIIGGAIAVGLVARSNVSAARQTLAGLADAAQQTTNDGLNPATAQMRARRTLQALRVQSVTVTANGAVQAGSALARNAVTGADVRQVLAGQAVSTEHRVAGQLVLVEGRPTTAGGIILIQRRVDATAVGDRAIRWILLALVIAVVVAIGLGLLVARRIALPLRRTADAAHALAAGQRNVAVQAEGPREVAEVGEAVNALAAGLAHSEARQREFLLSVSHDLRTPLTAIAGYAESLAGGVVPADQSAQVGQVMLGEAQRLNRLVADLLDLARLDAKEFRIEVADVDLVALAREAAQVWSDRCARAGVLFRLEVLTAPVGCRTDPARVRQILDGLLENALRVTPEGQPIVLSVRYENVPGGWLAVAEVRDGGPGLTEADMAVAFDRSALYERYRGVRQVGTGLGLAIVHGLTARLGGTIEAGRAAEGGARFTLRLPL